MARVSRAGRLRRIGTLLPSTRPAARATALACKRVAEARSIRRKSAPRSQALEPTMAATQLATLQCPCCGEQIEVIVDCSIENQEYVEDCSVCCRPLVITVAVSGGEIAAIHARSESE